jgi:hypothetical protein
MKNKKEAVEYCKEYVKSIHVRRDTNSDFFLVGLYDSNTKTRSLSTHIDTVYMSKRTLKAYLRDFLKLNSLELDKFLGKYDLYEYNYDIDFAFNPTTLI